MLKKQWLDPSSGTEGPSHLHEKEPPGLAIFKTQRRISQHKIAPLGLHFMVIGCLQNFVLTRCSKFWKNFPILDLKGSNLATELFNYIQQIKKRAAIKVVKTTSQKFGAEKSEKIKVKKERKKESTFQLMHTYLNLK